MLVLRYEVILFDQLLSFRGKRGGQMPPVPPPSSYTTVSSWLRPRTMATNAGYMHYDSTVVYGEGYHEQYRPLD